MEIQSIRSVAFQKYGRVLEGFDFAQLMETMKQTTPCPKDGVVYIASDGALETLPVAAHLRDSGFGGVPIQIGYCNGFSTVLNCLEYHRCSEIAITCDDIVLLLADQRDIDNGMLDMGRIQAFFVPARTGYELFATTLHYAPCAPADAGFRVAIILPKGTNMPIPKFSAICAEDRLLAGCNKWVLAHPDSPEAHAGATVGLTGRNIDIAE